VRRAILVLVCLVGCNKSDVKDAQKVIEKSVDKAEVLGREGIEQVGDGLAKVKDEVKDVVAPEELPDAKLVEKAKKAIACKKEQCKMPRELANDLLDRNELMSEQARTYRLHKGGKTIGVELQKLGPIPKALGFRAGDVLVEVNGVALDSMQGMAQLYVEMRTAETLAIAYRRGKRMRKKTIEFVEA